MFCRYCGKEILDQAVLCPHCGMMVKNVDFSALQEQTQPTAQPKFEQPIQPMQPTAQIQSEPTEEEKAANDLKTAKLARIFGIIAAVFIGLSLAVIISGIYSYLYYYQGYSSSQYSSELYESASAALLFGFVSLGGGIASFVLGLKQTNAAVRYISTVIFIASIFAVFIPLTCC